MTQAQSQPVVKSLQKALISCEIAVRLGRISMDCIRFGFCRIEQFSESILVADSRMIRAKMYYRKGRLQFRFNHADIAKMKFERYFETGFFVVEEDFQLPQFFCDLFGIKSFVIGEGAYEVKHQKSTLFFNCHSKTI